jgi:hypothetical protein
MAALKARFVLSVQRGPLDPKVSRRYATMSICIMQDMKEAHSEPYTGCGLTRFDGSTTVM